VLTRSGRRPSRSSGRSLALFRHGDALAGGLGPRQPRMRFLHLAERLLHIVRERRGLCALHVDMQRQDFRGGRDPAFGCVEQLLEEMQPLGIEIEAFVVPGKIPLYLEDEEAGVDLGTKEGDTLGLKVIESATGKHFFYVPGCAKLDEDLSARLKGAPLVFFDGTLYTNDEMIKQGLLDKTGDRMGHMNMSGSSGTIAAFADLGVKRKVFIHINNSNPALRDDGPERKAVEAAGWEVSYDGMALKV